MRRKARRKAAWLWLAAALGAGAKAGCLGQTAALSATPTADAFVWSLAPASNYGGAGALSVSGSAAVNGSGQQNGLLDSLIRFSTADVASSFNGSFGSNGWVVTSAALGLTEVGAPNNAIFDRGVGAFEVRWIGLDAWVEGSGTPMMPATDAVAYQDLGWVLNPAVDATLGQFTNSGANAAESFSLRLAEQLVSNIVSGADVNLYLTAASSSVGFTFNSRNFGSAGAWPSLQVAAAAKPAAAISAIERVGTNRVAIRFSTASNWVYVVQGVGGLGCGAWSNLFTVPAKPFDDQAEFVDTMTNRQRFYRLVLSPSG